MHRRSRAIIGLAAAASLALLNACDEKKTPAGTVPAGSPGVTGNPQTPVTPVGAASTPMGVWNADVDAMVKRWADERLKTATAMTRPEAESEGRSVAEKLVGEGWTLTFKDDGSVVFAPGDAGGTWKREGEIIVLTRGTGNASWRLKPEGAHLVEVPAEGSTPGIGLVLKRR